MNLAIWLCSNPQLFDVCSNESWGVCERLGVTVLQVVKVGCVREAGSDCTMSSESWGCVRDWE